MSVFLITLCIFVFIVYTIAILMVPVFIWLIHRNVAKILDCVASMNTYDL